MVPDKFNMVDMGGIDLIMMQGEEVPGLYDTLVESITQCRYQCLYNWFFDGIVIPPTYVEMEVNEEDEVAINEGVTVSPDDVIHIHSLEPGPVDPKIIPLLAEENGVYNVPAGIDGYSPVTVNVSGGGSKIIPAYQGLSYGYIGLDGNFYANNSNNTFVNIYEVNKGDIYCFFVGEIVSNRLRAQFYAGKTYQDFEDYILNSRTSSRVYVCTANITGNSDISGDGLKQRVYYVAPDDGIIFVATSNESVIANAECYVRRYNDSGLAQLKSDIMSTQYALLSTAVGDGASENGRSFSRTVSVPPLIFVDFYDTSGYNGYAAISPVALDQPSTYTAYGNIHRVKTLKTSQGTQYYLFAMEGRFQGYYPTYTVDGNTYSRGNLSSYVYFNENGIQGQAQYIAELEEFIDRLCGMYQ